MMNLTSNDVITLDDWDGNSNNEDDCRYKGGHTDGNMEKKDEIDNEDTYFNYGYSYDFVPDRLKDAKNQHTDCVKYIFNHLR